MRRYKNQLRMTPFKHLPGLLSFSLLKPFESELLHFVTTKQTPYGCGENFNIGFSGGIEDEILQNRMMLADSLGLKPENFVFQTQIHSNNHKIVTRKNAGNGFFSKETAVDGTDILITNEKNLCLVTRSADCTPVLLYSPDSKSVAAIHSGREGTYLHAAAKAAKLMAENFGADLSSMIACIGPAIGFECYEVGVECAEKFLSDQYFPQKTVIKKGGKYFLDLKTMIFESLVSSGLKRENIEVSDLCTKCSEKSFFSARRGDKQRFCAGIMIKG